MLPLPMNRHAHIARFPCSTLLLRTWTLNVERWMLNVEIPTPAPAHRRSIGNQLLHEIYGGRAWGSVDRPPKLCHPYKFFQAHDLSRKIALEGEEGWGSVKFCDATQAQRRHEPSPAWRIFDSSTGYAREPPEGCAVVKQRQELLKELDSIQSAGCASPIRNGSAHRRTWPTRRAAHCIATRQWRRTLQRPAPRRRMRRRVR